MSQFHNLLYLTGLVLSEELTSYASNLVMSTKVWQTQAREGSGVELPRAVGLILDMTCLFHPPTTTTNVLKPVQAPQEIF